MFDTLMVFLKEFSKKDLFIFLKKKSADDKKLMKVSQKAKSQRVFFIIVIPGPTMRHKNITRPKIKGCVSTNPTDPEFTCPPYNSCAIKIFSFKPTFPFSIALKNIVKLKKTMLLFPMSS